MKRQLTYQELKDIAKDVAKYINDKYEPGKYDLVAISRGGVTFGHLVSYYLAQPLHYFSTDFMSILWSSQCREGYSRVPIIFLEDVIAQGRTFKLVEMYMEGTDMDFPERSDYDISWEFIPVVMDPGVPEEIRLKVNKVGIETSDWIVFPHEDFDLTVEGDRGLFRQGTSINSTFNVDQK